MAFTLLRFTAYTAGAVAAMRWFDSHTVEYIRYPRETALGVGVVTVALLEGSVRAGRSAPPTKVKEIDPSVKEFLQQLMGPNYREGLQLREVIELCEDYANEQIEEIDRFWKTDRERTIKIICDVAQVPESDRPDAVLQSVQKLTQYLCGVTQKETPQEVLTGLQAGSREPAGGSFSEVKVNLMTRLCTPQKKPRN